METKTQNNPYDNITHSDYSQNNNIYPNHSDDNSPYPIQPMAVEVKQEDSIYTKRLKEHFPFFGIGSALYALFYTFCLYKNASGITYPFFVVGTLCYFFFSMRKLGVPYKKDSVFYIVSIVLLGISNCLTNSEPLLLMNKCGIFLLSFILMIHTIYMDKTWNFPKYLCTIMETIGTVFTCILRPFSDMIFYFDAQKREKSGKQSYFVPVLIGVAITIPMLFVMTSLLVSADIVFSDMLGRILPAFNLPTIFGVSFLTVLVFFCSYAVYAALGMKNVKGTVEDHRVLEPVIAIIVTAALSALYMVFSMIQILYLFIGNMQLPMGYTYSQYARQGFFQLLAVCIMNLIIVLICLHLFRENTALKVILTVISGCTFIMILSSALRMLMYIDRYNLTFLRILVLWALAVIFLLMAGVTILIYRNKFPLFTYSMVIVTVFYIGLSFAHPDFWIAKYNLNPQHLDYLNEYDVYDSQKYLSGLSADAAPILLNEEQNPYMQANVIGNVNAGDIIKNWNILTEAKDMIKDWNNTTEYKNLADLAHDSMEKLNDVAKELKWLHCYYDKIDNLSADMHIRSFNFSVYTAGKYME